MSAKPASRRESEPTVNLLEALKVAADSQKNIVELPLRSILLDRAFQVRVGGLDADHLSTLRESVRDGGKFKDEIVVYDTPAGRFLTDGWHRYTIAMEFNWVTITSELRSGTYEQALEAAEEANLKHGKMLSNEDKKNLLIRRLERGHTWTNLSARDIARQLGVSHPTITNWKDNYTKMTGKFLPVESVVGKDGRIYDTTKIRDANKGREKTTGKNLPVTPAQQRNHDAFIDERLEKLAAAIHDESAKDYPDAARLEKLQNEKALLEKNGSYRETYGEGSDWYEANKPLPGGRWDDPPFVSQDEAADPYEDALSQIRKMAGAVETLTELLNEHGDDLSDSQAVELKRRFGAVMNECGTLLGQMRKAWGV